MMRSFKTLVFAGFATLVLASAPRLKADDSAPTGQAPPADKPKKPQTICPVMGGPIDKNLYVDVKGKRIYLCCAACEEPVRVETDKYIKKIEARGETVEDAPSSN